MNCAWLRRWIFKSGIYRKELAAMAGIIFFAFLSPGRAALGEAKIIAGPMVGHVSDTNARIWFELSSTEDAVTINCIDVVDRQEVSGITLDVDGPLPAVCDAALNGLQPNHNYRIEVSVGGKPVQLPGPELVIRTPPPPGEPADFTLAFGADDDPELFPNQPIWNAITAMHPRAFLFAGNAGYMFKTADEFPKSHRAAFRYMVDFRRGFRDFPPLQPLLHSAANYAIWNDRDFGPGDSDRTFVDARESLASFERYWPNPAYGNADALGTFCNFTIGDVDVFMLDNRMFRDPDKDPNRKTMLGDAQLSWLKQSLLASKATFKIIAAGGPMLADYGTAESWALYKPERDEFVNWIFKNHINGVIFLSGGRGFAELTRRTPADAAQYPLFDLTSSSLAAKMVDNAVGNAVNPQRVGAAFFDHNFGALDFGGPADHRHVTLRIRDEQGTVKIEKTILAGELHGTE